MSLYDNNFMIRHSMRSQESGINLRLLYFFKREFEAQESEERSSMTSR